MPFSAEQQRTKVPVTIITGFLGAGKTSLLNYLLKEKGNKRIAVVENEFGEVNIDRELVSDNLLEKEDLVSLDNGCVCCSLRKDIVKALAQIETRACRRANKVDAVLLETTGLADPAPVAFTFFANPWVASRYKLDSIICVVDARYLMQHLDDLKPQGAVNEAVNQVAFSDLILLNKIDLVSCEEKAAVLKRIRHINSMANIVECQLNEPSMCPPIEQLLQVNSFSVSKALDVDENFLDSESDEEDGFEREGPLTEKEEEAAASLVSYRQRRKVQLREAAQKLEASNVRKGDRGDATAVPGEPSKVDILDSHPEDPNHPPSCSCHGHKDDELHEGDREPRRHHKKLHDLSDVSSVAISAGGPLDSYRFNMFMKDLLAEKSKDIFRCKGVLAVHGQGNQKFIFQGVHETICYGPADSPWKPDEVVQNRIVFIGRCLDRKSLIEGFRSCVWVPLPEGWKEYMDPKTNQPFYVEEKTNKKTWFRPDVACAHVIASYASMKQPAVSPPAKGSGQQPDGVASMLPVQPEQPEQAQPMVPAPSAEAECAK